MVLEFRFNTLSCRLMDNGFHGYSPRTRKNHLSRSNKSISPNKKQKLSKNGGGLGNIMEVVQKDVPFLKAGFSKGLQWANFGFWRCPSWWRIDMATEYRDLPASFFRFPFWPQPSGTRALCLWC